MIRSIAFLLRWVLALLMSLLAISITWQVVSRYALGEPSLWTEEFARFAMIWLGVLGASYAYIIKAHLALDLFPTTDPRWAKRREGFSHGVVLIFALSVMCFGGGRLVLLTWTLDQLSPALGLPMALVYAVVPLSGGLLAVFCLHGLVMARDKAGPTHD